MPIPKSYESSSSQIVCVQLHLNGISSISFSAHLYDYALSSSLGWILRNSRLSQSLFLHLHNFFIPFYPYYILLSFLLFSWTSFLVLQMHQFPNNAWRNRVLPVYMAAKWITSVGIIINMMNFVCNIRRQVADQVQMISNRGKPAKQCVCQEKDNARCYRRWVGKWQKKEMVE